MTYLPLKRGREEEIMHNLKTMANYLIHFSNGAHDSFEPKKRANSPGQFECSPGQFECRTCNRQFTSFQALGGHRASHKRPRFMGGGDLTNHRSLAKSKSHECSICGLEFALGQALGGHMRRHRALSENHLSGPLQQVEVAKKVNDHEIRVFGVNLNLTPLENELEFGIKKVAPNLVKLCL